MRDKIAQLIFEKIKTPEIKETDSLEETGRGDKGYGSTGLNGGQLNEGQSIKSKMQKTNEGKQNETQTRNEAIPVVKNKRSQLEKARQIISARQLQKLAKNDSSVFLAIVWSNDFPNKRDENRGKRSQNRVAKFSTTHGLTEGPKAAHE